MGRETLQLANREETLVLDSQDLTMRPGLERHRTRCYNSMFCRPRSTRYAVSSEPATTGSEIMAKRCDICGKGPVVGRNISHAHNVTPRRFEPNLQRVRALVNGGIQRLRVCTRCLRSGKVTKAA
jgi:large subunit ribosomal protein L28